MSPGFELLEVFLSPGLSVKVSACHQGLASKRGRGPFCYQGLNYSKFLSFLVTRVESEWISLSPGFSIKKGERVNLCHHGLNYSKFFVTGVQIFESAGHQGLSSMGERNYFGHQS